MKLSSVLAAIVPIALSAGLIAPATQAQAVDNTAPCYSNFYRTPITATVVNETIDCINTSTYYVASSFTTTSWQYLTTQLNLASGYVSIGLYDNALIGINTAVDYLQFRANTASLSDTLSKYPNATQATLYTTATWTPYYIARVAAEAIVADPSDSTQIDADAQELVLLKYALALVRVDGTTNTGTDGSSGTNTGTTGSDGDTTSGLTAVKVKAPQTTVTLIKGKTISLTSLGYTANGAKLTVKYKSSNTSVATISAMGKITAKKVGKATISYTFGAKKTTVSLTVVVKDKATAVKSVTATGVPTTMKVGAVKYITGKYTPSNATGVKVYYSSSNKKILTVDVAGRIDAKAKGKATITVKAGTKSKKYTITVT
jgi:uncharacterized protein YjdB